MWDAFLKRSCESCMDIGTPKNSFVRRRLDINSVEYQSYIHKDVLGYLDKYAMPSKPSKKMRSNVNKNLHETDTNKKQDPKYKPVYFRVEKPRDEAGKSHGTKSVLSKNVAKVDGCACSKSPKNKNKIENVPAIYESVPTKCGQCDVQKKKQNSAGSKKLPNPPPSQEVAVKNIDKPKESTIKRHPILILRKKCVKTDELSIVSDGFIFNVVTPLKFNFGKWTLYKVR